MTTMDAKQMKKKIKVKVEIIIIICSEWTQMDIDPPCSIKYPTDQQHALN